MGADVDIGSHTCAQASEGWRPRKLSEGTGGLSISYYSESRGVVCVVDIRVGKFGGARVVHGVVHEYSRVGGCNATIFDGQILLVTRGAVLEHSEGAWAEVVERQGATSDLTCASLLLG